MTAYMLTCLYLNYSSLADGETQWFIFAFRMTRKARTMTGVWKTWKHHGCSYEIVIQRTHTNIHFLSPHKVQDQELNYLWWRLRLCQFSPAMCPRVWYHNCWVVLSCSRYSGVLHTYYSYSFSPAWKLISLMLSSTHAYCRMHPAPNLPTYTCDRNVTTWVWLISCVVPTRPLHVTFHCSRVWMGVAGVCDPQPTAETISVLLTIKIPRVRPNIKSH